MNVDDFAEEVIRGFVRDITDHIFIYIQNDTKLLRDYMSLYNDHNLKQVNPRIGQKVKEILKLDDDGENKEPKSGLITKYTCHKVKNEQ